MGVTCRDEGRNLGDRVVMIEHREGVEFRVAGRTLTGRALVYGDVSPGFQERFLPGSLAPVPAVPLNLQHDASTTLIAPGAFILNDSERALEVRAELPPSSAALQLVRRGALNGFSIEFRAQSERREAGIRVIERAELTGIALVDRGAYPQSVAEIRARGGGGGRGVFGGRLGSFRGRIPANKRVECRCSPGSCREALFKNGAFDSLLDDADKREVLAVSGDYKNAIASKTRETVRFWQGKNGDIEFAVDVPNTDLGKQVMDSINATDLYARPVIDVGASSVKIEGTLAEYTKARVRALTIGATDANKGWDALEEVSESALTLAEKAKALAGLSRPARRRARIWL